MSQDLLSGVEDPSRRGHGRTVAKTCAASGGEASAESSERLYYREGRDPCHRPEKDHRCPFLTEKKLCALVSAYGDAVLSETCTDFPREVHVFSDHEEETLMPCCPAVIDIWEKKSRAFQTFRGRGKPPFPGTKGDSESSGRRKISPEEALLAAFYILLDLKGRKKPIPADVRDCFSEKRKRTLKSHPEGSLSRRKIRLWSATRFSRILQSTTRTRGFTGIFWIPCWSSQRPFPRGNGTRFWKKNGTYFYRNGKMGWTHPEIPDERDLLRPGSGRFGS
ncbi:MAG: flagellin lysine-N-methylase [Blautia sp.]